MAKLSLSKKKGKSYFRNTVIIMLILCVAQAAFLAYRWSQNQVETFAIANEAAVSGLSDPVEQARQKLQLAMMQFGARNGKLPLDFDQLVPDYLAEIPRNPKTGEEFLVVEEGLRALIATSIEEARAIKAKLGGHIRGDHDDSDIPDPVGWTDPFVYNPSGKRDPFLPYGRAPERPCDGTPIECTSIVKLKLALVIDTGAEKKAMVETPDGRGYSVKIGSKIGNNHGEVADIQPDKVLVLEQTVDLAGNKNERIFELRLRQDPEEVANDKKGLSTIGRGYNPQ